jgi:7,8-dihydro-6-hydroxymethylpterin-pyrophosphokinase
VLLGYLHAIEVRHGRTRAAARSAHEAGWEDRTLDLDLIAYGDVVSDDPRLLLPHPRAGERDFVLEPWLAVDPDAVLPGVGRVDEALQRLRAEAAESAGEAEQQ